MPRITHRFIAMPNRLPVEVAKELEALFEKAERKPSRAELLRLATALNNIPHRFEAEYDETPAATPGWVERRLVPGTLRDLGPVSPEEYAEQLRKNLEKMLVRE